MSRIRTTGILETRFKISGTVFDIFDVGGQRNERKKWVRPATRSRQGAYFVAGAEPVTHPSGRSTASTRSRQSSSSSPSPNTTRSGRLPPTRRVCDRPLIGEGRSSPLTQVLFEDKRVNRMVEALELFEETVNSTWFTNVDIILFLNKVDMLANKMQRVPISRCFQIHRRSVGRFGAGVGRSPDRPSERWCRHPQETTRRLANSSSRTWSWPGTATSRRKPFTATSRRPPTRPTSSTCSAPSETSSYKGRATVASGA